MKQMKRITLRLSLEKSEDKAILDFLEHIDKAKYHTVNTAIKAILYSAINGTVMCYNKVVTPPKKVI